MVPQPGSKALHDVGSVSSLPLSPSALIPTSLANSQWSLGLRYNASYTGSPFLPGLGYGAFLLLFYLHSTLYYFLVLTTVVLHLRFSSGPPPSPPPIKPRLIGVVVPTAQMRKPRLREVKQLVQGHTASSWQGLDHYPGLRFPTDSLFHLTLSPSPIIRHGYVPAG